VNFVTPRVTAISLHSEEIISFTLGDEPLVLLGMKEMSVTKDERKAMLHANILHLRCCKKNRPHAAFLSKIQFAIALGSTHGL